MSENVLILEQCCLPDHYSCITVCVLNLLFIYSAIQPQV